MLNHFNRPALFSLVLLGLVACDTTDAPPDDSGIQPPGNPGEECEDCSNDGTIAKSFAGMVSYPSAIQGGYVCIDVSQSGSCQGDDPKSDINRYGEYRIEVEVPIGKDVQIIAVIDIEGSVTANARPDGLQAQTFNPNLDAVNTYFGVTENQVTLRAREFYGHVSPITEIELRELDKTNDSDRDMYQSRINNVLSDMFNVRPGTNYARAIQQAGYLENLALYSEAALIAEDMTSEPIAVPVAALQAKMSILRDPTTQLRSVVENLLRNAGYTDQERGSSLSYHQMASVLTQIGMDNRDYNAIVFQEDSIQIRDARNRVTIDIFDDEVYVGQPEYMNETCWSSKSQQWEGMRPGASPTDYVHTIENLRVTPDSGGISMTNKVTGYEFALQTRAVQTNSEYFQSLLEESSGLANLKDFDWPQTVYWLEYYDTDYIHACVDPDSSLGVSLDGLSLSQLTADDVVRLTNPPAYETGRFKISEEQSRITYEMSGDIYRYEVLSFPGGLEALRQVPVFSPDGNASPMVSVDYQGELVPIFGFADGLYEELSRSTHQFVMEDVDIERLVSDIKE